MAVRFINEHERRFFTEEALSLAYSMFAEKVFPDHIVEAVMTEAVRWGCDGYTVDEAILSSILWAICEKPSRGMDVQSVLGHNSNKIRLS